MPNLTSWAVGTFLTVSLAATLAGTQLARVAPQIGAAAGSAEPSPSRLPSSTPSLDRVVTILGDRQGHFLVQPSIDGRRTTMMVDTGATIVALTSEDAAAIGIRPLPAEYRGVVSTANGTVKVASVRIREIRLGEIVVRDVAGAVMPPGALGMSLLGMSFLRQLRSFDVTRGQLTLRG